MASAPTPSPSSEISMCGPTPAKKQRKANWTSREIWILLEEVRLEKASQITNEITNKAKKAIWQRIADKLSNTCGVDARTPQSVREKWGVLKSDAQRRRDKRRATEGGIVKYSEYDAAVFDITGEESALIDGINVENTDTFQLHVASNVSAMASDGPTMDIVKLPPSIEMPSKEIEDVPQMLTDSRQEIAMRLENSVQQSSKYNKHGAKKKKITAPDSRLKSTDDRVFEIRN